MEDRDADPACNRDWTRITPDDMRIMQVRDELGISISSILRLCLADEWRVAADLEILWTVLRRLEEWPDWWPSVRSLIRLDPGTEKGEGAVWRFVFQTRLPYKMRFDAEFVRVDPLIAVEARVQGRVEGSGLWSLTDIAGGTLVRFDWLVTPQVGWMRAVAPLARGVFSWNHRALMSEGAEALAQRLGVRLLAPPLSAAA